MKIHFYVLKTRLKIFIFSALLIFLGLIVVDTQWNLLKYRFFIESPSNKMIVNAEYFVGSIIDAVRIVGNQFLLSFNNAKLPKESNIETIHLKVEKGSIQKMAKNLPHSAKEKYYPATLLYPDGEWKPLKYRFRGRNIWHWHPNKPSLRLNFKKKFPRRLQDKINLVNPEDRAMVSNVIGEELGRRLGVLTHVTDYVRLFINNGYRGVYHRTTVEDKNMLLLNKRMPGPIFIGDHLKTPWESTNFEIKGDLKILKKFNPLNELLNTLSLPTGKNKYSKLWKILSFEKYAAWQATMNIAGGIHTDGHHNHLYFYDPALGQIEPMISDINGHGLLTKPVSSDIAKRVLSIKFNDVPSYEVPINEKLQQLLYTALLDPRFYHRRNQILYDAIHGVGSRMEQSKILNKYYSLIDPDVKADRNKESIIPLFVGWFRVPYSNGQYDQAKQNLLEWIKKRNIFLLNNLRKTDLKTKIYSDGNTHQVLVSLSGYSSLYFNPDDLIGKIYGYTPFENNSVKEISETILLSPGLRKEHKQAYKPGNPNRSRNFTLLPDFQYYAFKVKSIPQKKLLISIQNAFTHSLTKEKIRPGIVIESNPLDIKNVQYNKLSLHPWSLVLSLDKSDIIIGPEEVVLHKDLVIPEYRKLIILAGTTLKLGKDVSIVTKGPVHIKGTEQKPVNIQRLSANHPWGAFIIQGERAIGSNISFTHFSGGSQGHFFNIYYSGMVSIHNADNISIHNSSFSHNIFSDDMLHLVYSKGVKLKNISFENCFADSIDLDYAKGDIQNITIDHTGNDGIDFMSSKFTLSNIYITDAKDKGMSIGEQSNVQIQTGIIERSNTGIAIKDDSLAKISNMKLKQNNVAIDLFMKKAYFGGSGNGHLNNVKFLQNEVNIQIEDNGKILCSQDIPSKIFGDGIVEKVKNN